MSRGKKTDKETEKKILRMAGQGISGNQIAKKLDMHVNTVNGILRRNQSGKFKYTTHCYTCEYSIYSDRASTKRAMPTVKGCLLRCDTPKTCRNWHDDQMTAERVKADLRGKLTSGRETMDSSDRTEVIP